MNATIDFCSEITTVGSGEIVTIGREADLCLDENPFLHRRFLQLAERGGIWCLTNVGSQLTATLSDADGRMEAYLAPGASIPLVFGSTVVSFTAGPTTYEFSVGVDDVAWESPRIMAELGGQTTVGPSRLNVEQHLLVLALAEPRLRGDGRAVVTMPTSQAAATRLGWTITKFNRKLDALCSKLAKSGVRGLTGQVDDMASHRRARLVEYAVATRMVTRADLPLLDPVGGS